MTDTGGKDKVFFDEIAERKVGVGISGKNLVLVKDREGEIFEKHEARVSRARKKMRFLRKVCLRIFRELVMAEHAISFVGKDSVGMVDGEFRCEVDVGGRNGELGAWDIRKDATIVRSDDFPRKRITASGQKLVERGKDDFRHWN